MDAPFTLEDLVAIVRERGRSGDPGSYTAKLIAKGPARVAKKFGEEAVETVIAAVEGDAAALTAEAADMLYHFAVLLEVRGVALDAVMAELASRTGRTGLEEKASRPPE
ncbi:MAG: phosphoribosyl-ATP diphosphatase [Bosea sp.]|nr:phosphoribosyl-ATP diphosphatase [Bosea sp. (in: a-proteobacteria)]